MSKQICLSRVVCFPEGHYEKVKPAIRLRQGTYVESSFWINLLEKRSELPTNKARAPPEGWKPAIKESWLPAHKPSPPFSTESASESGVLSESAAKLSAGALRMGTKRGLFPSAKGTPENHTGAVFGERRGDVEGTFTGITVSGSARSGK